MSKCCKEFPAVQYLPRFAREAKDARVRQIGYSVDRDPVTSRVTFGYNVTWTDIDDSLARRYEALKIGVAQKSQKSADSVKDEALSGLPRLIKCDGACNTWAPEDYIIQFGLCDHNICYTCYENEESISLTNDGSRGCCNKECVARAKAELAIKTPISKSPLPSIALGSRSRYVAFPGTKKKSNIEQGDLHKSRQRKKLKSKWWKAEPPAVNSEVSFFGDYDDTKLQEMAEVMRSAATEEHEQRTQERQIC